MIDYYSALKYVKTKNKKIGISYETKDSYIFSLICEDCFHYEKISDNKGIYFYIRSKEYIDSSLYIEIYKDEETKENIFNFFSMSYIKLKQAKVVEYVYRNEVLNEYKDICSRASMMVEYLDKNSMITIKDLFFNASYGKLVLSCDNKSEIIFNYFKRLLYIKKIKLNYIVNNISSSYPWNSYIKVINY